MTGFLIFLSFLLVCAVASVITVLISAHGQDRR